MSLSAEGPWLSARRGWRGQQKLKYNPPTFLTQLIYLLLCLKVYEFNQSTIRRTILARREGEIGSGKSAFGIYNCLRGQF